MHFAFIPYGHKLWVDILLRDIQAQKVKHIYRHPKKPEKADFIQMGLRVLPFGVYELIFPEEDLGRVLTTLMDNSENAYGVPKIALAAIRKSLKLKPVPKKWDDSEKFLWIKQNVAIIPIGIKKDKIHTLPDGYEVEGL